MKNFRKYFLRGSLSHLLPLGAGFVMASSQSVEAALAMSLAVTIVTVLSAMIVSALRKVTPEKAHLPIYVLIVTGITTLLCMLMEAYWITGFNALGVHLAALAVSAVPYRDAEELASQNGEKKTIICSLITSALFAIVMIVCSLLTEPLVSGSILGFSLGFDGLIEAGAAKFMSYVFLAIVIAAMRKIGHKVCDELEAE
jgi:electron transport complex protein RnfE